MFGRKRAQQEIQRALDRCLELRARGQVEFAVQLNLLEAGGGRSRIYAFIETAQDVLGDHGFAVTAVDVAEWQYTATFAVTDGRASSRAAAPIVPAAAGGIQFDPQGPEKAGAEGQAAFTSARYLEAFVLYVKAVDRLHDFYVFESFRNRQPSPQDLWIVEGLVASLDAARTAQPGVDVREPVREATHRLRTIASACDRAGANATMYREGLDGLARCASDVDVSDIFWG